MQTTTRSGNILGVNHLDEIGAYLSLSVFSTGCVLLSQQVINHHQNALTIVLTLVARGALYITQTLITSNSQVPISWPCYIFERYMSSHLTIQLKNSTGPNFLR